MDFQQFQTGKTGVLAKFDRPKCQFLWKMARHFGGKIQIGFKSVQKYWLLKRFLLYRRRELSKAATLKMARLKTLRRRERRRMWIQEQIRMGKLHKSALIWVNSNKLLPFEKEEKSLPSSTFSKSLWNKTHCHSMTILHWTGLWIQLKSL